MFGIEHVSSFGDKPFDRNGVFFLFHKVREDDLCQRYTPYKMRLSLAFLSTPDSIHDADYQYAKIELPVAGVLPVINTCMKKVLCGHLLFGKICNN
jgi:hypothetical protein